MEKKYMKGKQASELLGVHQRTLMQWDKLGKIDTIRTTGNYRLYDVSKFIKEKTQIETQENNMDSLKMSID